MSVGIVPAHLPEHVSIALLVVDHFLADAAVSVVLGTLQQIAIGVVLIIGRITRHIPVAVILGIADVISIFEFPFFCQDFIFFQTSSSNLRSLK